MWLFKFVFLCVFLASVAQEYESDDDDSEEARMTDGEKKMSDNILKVLEHFKQPDPVGLPGAEVPDPSPVPDTKQTITLGSTLNLKNTLVYGVSKFRILYVNVEISKMEFQATVGIDNLQARGNYSLSTWLNTARGPFTVDVTNLTATARGNLAVERDGKLRVQDIFMDLSFSNIQANFQNLGFFGSVVQGFINSGGSSIIFDSIKPYILKEAYGKVRNEINAKLDEIAGDIQFPSSISPLDMVIIDLRNKVRQMPFDPYQVQAYNKTMGIFTISLNNTWITGISTFHRIDNITLRMEKNTLVADFAIGTQKLEGRTGWEISAINGLLSTAGTASFSVEYISVRVVLAQPLDTRKKPQLRDLDLDMGNIQVRCDGAGTLDYVIEFAVNILPNLIRYQILNALEGPLIQVVQQQLDKINVEQTLKDQLPSLDSMASSQLKLSALKSQGPIIEPVDEDEFFNF